MAKYLVLWTGGLDSTSLVYRLLQQGHIVHTVYITLLNNAEKVRSELQAISKIKPHLEKFNTDDTCRFSHIGPISSIYIHSHGSAYNLKQVSPFILSIPYMADIHTYDYVAMGYTMNDCAISYLDDIQKIYKALDGLCNIKLPKLAFPLVKVHKYESWQLLPQEIRAKIFWCESPEISPCNICPPCRRMIDAEIMDEYTKLVEVEKLNQDDGSTKAVEPVLF